MSGITTHVLDLSRGTPASGVTVTLAKRDGEGWQELRRADTDADGRVPDLLSGEETVAAVYRLRFAVGDYFAASGRETFYPHADVTFRVADPTRHHHVPLLVGPFGYTTYRGS